MPSFSIAIVRHGETTANKERWVAGQQDVPLNEEGFEQARAARATLPAECTEIWSSDLLRCRQTTEALNEERGLPVIYDARLRERDFGSLEGKGYDDPAFAGDFWEKDRSQQYDYRAFGGECAEEVAKRFFACLADMRAKGGRPLVVTSAGIVKVLRHYLHGTTEGHIKNSVIEEFEIPDDIETRVKVL